MKFRRRVYFGLILAFLVLLGSLVPLEGVLSRNVLLSCAAGLCFAIAVVSINLWMVWDLADEVWDEGGTVRIKKGDEEIRLSYADIADVRRSTPFRPLAITLVLREKSALGSRIAFSPCSAWADLYPCEIADVFKAKPGQSVSGGPSQGA